MKVKANASIFGKWTEVAVVKAETESMWFKSLAKETFGSVGHDEILARCVLQIDTVVAMDGGETMRFRPLTVSAIEGRVVMQFLTTVSSVIHPEVKCEGTVTITVYGTLSAMRVEGLK